MRPSRHGGTQNKYFQVPVRFWIDPTKPPFSNLPTIHFPNSLLGGPAADGDSSEEEPEPPPAEGRSHDEDDDDDDEEEEDVNIAGGDGSHAAQPGPARRERGGRPIGGGDDDRDGEEEEEDDHDEGFLPRPSFGEERRKEERFMSSCRCERIIYVWGIETCSNMDMVSEGHLEVISVF